MPYGTLMVCIAWSNGGLLNMVELMVILAKLYISMHQTTIGLKLHFICATRKHGWPSQVRSDHGGENIDTARAMIMCRGIGWASHISGDTFCCVCHSYYALFYEMETPESGQWQTSILHYLPRINMLSRFIPSQLWTHGLCIASPSLINQPNEYGIGLNVESVTIWETDIGLTPLQLDYLRHHHTRLLLRASIKVLMYT